MPLLPERIDGAAEARGAGANPRCDPELARAQTTRRIPEAFDRASTTPTRHHTWAFGCASDGFPQATPAPAQREKPIGQSGNRRRRVNCAWRRGLLWLAVRQGLAGQTEGQSGRGG